MPLALNPVKRLNGKHVFSPGSHNPRFDGCTGRGCPWPARDFAVRARGRAVRWLPVVAVAGGSGAARRRRGSAGLRRWFRASHGGPADRRVPVGVMAGGTRVDRGGGDRSEARRVRSAGRTASFGPCPARRGTPAGGVVDRPPGLRRSALIHYKSATLQTCHSDWSQHARHSEG